MEALDTKYMTWDVNPDTGEDELRPMTEAERADKDRQLELSAQLQAVLAADARQAETDKAAARQAISDMPTAEDIEAATKLPELREMTLKLHAAVAALIKHTRMDV